MPIEKSQNKLIEYQMLTNADNLTYGHSTSEVERGFFLIYALQCFFPEILLLSTLNSTPSKTALKHIDQKQLNRTHLQPLKFIKVACVFYVLLCIEKEEKNNYGYADN